MGTRQLSTKNKGISAMTHEVDSADVTFAEVPMTGFGAGAGSIAIATFGSTIGCGRTRTARSAATWRDPLDRRVARNAGGQRALAQNCAVACGRHARRRVRDGKGSGGPVAAHAQRQEQRTVRKRELRRHSGESGRGRALWLRAWRLHRRGAPAPGLLRAGRAAERFSSTRSRKCRSTCRRSCCACSRAGA